MDNKETQDTFERLVEGGTYMYMFQKINGKKVGLKVCVSVPYDYETVKYNACKMVDALQKYKEEHGSKTFSK